MSRRTLLALLPFLLLAAGCLTVNIGGRNVDIGRIGQGLLALRPMRFDTERSIGEAISTQLIHSQGRVRRDKDITEYVNLVGTSIAIVSDRPEIPWNFAVLDSAEINAFAAPGGYVYVTTAALDAMRSEAELACVLAHEIAHVTEQHTVKQIRRQRIGGALAEAGRAALDDDAPRFFGAVDSAAETILSKGFSASEEADSDKIAVELAAAAGYDPRAMIDFLRILEQHEQTDREWTLFKTHPPAADRIRSIEEAIATMDPALVPVARNQTRFEERLGRE